jgi:hypothetical protein
MEFIGYLLDCPALAKNMIPPPLPQGQTATADLKIEDVVKSDKRRRR